MGFFLIKIYILFEALVEPLKYALNKFTLLNISVASSL